MSVLERAHVFEQVVSRRASTPSISSTIPIPRHHKRHSIEQKYATLQNSLLKHNDVLRDLASRSNSLTHASVEGLSTAASSASSTQRNSFTADILSGSASSTLSSSSSTSSSSSRSSVFDGEGTRQKFHVMTDTTNWVIQYILLAHGCIFVFETEDSPAPIFVINVNDPLFKSELTETFVICIGILKPNNVGLITTQGETWQYFLSGMEPTGSLKVYQSIQEVRQPFNSSSITVPIAASRAIPTPPSTSPPSSVRQRNDTLRIPVEGSVSVEGEREYTTSPFLSSSDDDDSVDHRAVLLKGMQFQKYKRGSVKTRWVWCTASLDRIQWGPSIGKRVKNYISTRDLVSVTEGCVGGKKQECCMTIIAKERTLNLEAETVSQKQLWMHSMQYLIDMYGKSPSRKRETS